MDAFEAVVLVIVFLYGIVIGSFLNVCIYRIPEGESLVKVRSRCMSCGYQLKWHDLVPVFSWTVLRGKCRKCRSRISVQYPLIEALNGIAYAGIFWVTGFDTAENAALSVLYCLLFSALLALSVIDWRTFEIPVGFNYFIGILGAARLVMDYRNWPEYIIGFFAVSLFLELLLWVSRGKAIGGGDVKLMAAAGLLLGWKKILLGFFIGCIAGSVIHLIRMKISEADRVLAMGPYLSAGIMTAALWGDGLIQAYISMLGFR